MKLVPVPCIDLSDGSLGKYLTHSYDWQQPLLVRHGASHWSAVKDWTPQYFAQHWGDKFVLVSVSNEEQQTTVKSRRRLADFIDSIVVDSDSTDDDGSPKAARRQKSPYLKQFDPRTLSPSLADCLGLSELRGSRFWFGELYTWIGGRGAITGCHNDDEHNALCQIYGEKRVVLFSPEDRLRLYPNLKYDSGTECCDVDPLLPDFNRHPRLYGSVGLDARLRPGDVLLVPRFWYHHVVSLSANISVNYFLSSPLDFLIHGLPRILLHFLHTLGLYSTHKNCVCHAPQAASC
jgi:lysine-specific demethylase 8